MGDDLDAIDRCSIELVEIAYGYFVLGDKCAIARAKSILFSLLSSEYSFQSGVHSTLGRIYEVREGNFRLAYEHYLSALLIMGDFKEIDTLDAMVCKWHVGDYAQSRFFASKLKISSMGIEEPEMKREAIELVILYQRSFRQLRDSCGGCGVTFEGKARKFCRGCRTFCYCSRECQTMHWNRKKGGHREDCLGLVELKKKLREARRTMKEVHYF